MLLDDDFENDRAALDVFTIVTNTKSSMFVFLSRQYFATLHYKDSKRISVNLKVPSRAGKVVWIHLSLDRADITEQYHIVGNKLSVCYTDTDFIIEHELELGKRISIKGYRLPYGSQKVWSKFLEEQERLNIAPF